MEELYKLKKMLCKELEQYGDKKDLSAGSLEVVDKLAHSVKNICKIIEMYDDSDYSNASYGSYGSYDDGNSYNNSMASYNRRYSRDGGYSTRQHYVRGHYSRADGLVEQLRDMEDEAPNNHIRQEIHKLVEKMEQM